MNSIQHYPLSNKELEEEILRLNVLTGHLLDQINKQNKSIYFLLEELQDFQARNKIIYIIIQRFRILLKIERVAITKIFINKSNIKSEAYIVQTRKKTRLQKGNAQ